MSIKLRLLRLLLAGFPWAFLMTSARADEDVIGKKAKEWDVTDWLNSKPLSLKDQDGKVVLVRWWMAPGCPYCAATAPALNEFHKKYQDQGLVVIGFYHHKSATPLDKAKVKDAAQRLGFKFPVAIDPEWRTLRRWWLDGTKRDWTSVSFLIDRNGVNRHVHPGGQYVKGDKAYEALESKIEELLKEE